MCIHVKRDKEIKREIFFSFSTFSFGFCTVFWLLKDAFFEFAISKINYDSPASKVGTHSWCDLDLGRRLSCGCLGAS